MRSWRAARRWWALGILSVAAFAVAAGLGRPRLEQAIRARIEREAVRRGLGLRLTTVQVGFSPLLRLTGVGLSSPGRWSLSVASLDARLRLLGSGLLGRTRLSLGPLEVSGPGGLALETLPTEWDVSESPSRAWRAELRSPGSGLSVELSPGAAPETGSSRIEVVAAGVPLGQLITVRRAGLPLLDAGSARGALRVGITEGAKTFDLDVGLRGARVAALGNDPVEVGVSPSFGLPTDATLRLSGAWRPGEAVLTVPSWRATVDGATAAGTLLVADLPEDPRVELSFEVERVDFARLLGTSGLSQPAAVVPPASTLADGDLGSASLSARIEGRLAEPRSFKVTQRLDFTPPRRALPALERLRGDFNHEVVLRSGGRRTIAVSPDSEGFISFADVPPLFVRTLLLGEDSGFFGHRGIDLSELPSAILTNWSRGDSARGASTITQQLAKNLFLSREKKLGRKLQELSLALLLEATLSKERVLEIYCNVIEWGPDLYGLRPAARHYFGREPGQLTPRQMAFLVALIPGPVKYQRSFADGTLSSGFRPLVDALLAKLRSVDALSEEEYQVALAEELRIGVPPDAESESEAPSAR